MTSHLNTKADVQAALSCVLAIEFFFNADNFADSYHCWATAVKKKAECFNSFGTAHPLSAGVSRTANSISLYRRNARLQLNDERQAGIGADVIGQFIDYKSVMLGGITFWVSNKYSLIF
jgi:hypothetical protein